MQSSYQKRHIRYPDQRVLHEVNVHTVAHVLADQVLEQQPDEKKIDAVAPVVGGFSGDNHRRKTRDEQDYSSNGIPGNRIAHQPHDAQDGPRTQDRCQRRAGLWNISSSVNHR